MLDGVFNHCGRGFWPFHHVLENGPTSPYVDWFHILYDWEINYAQFNLIGSHDTARALMIMGGDKSALRLAVLLQMTMPGAPCVYYGDEIGMSSWGDPQCRAAFPWHEETMWDQDLLEFYRQAIAMRHQHPVLRTGSFKTVHAEGDVYAFARRLEQQEALVVIRAGTTSASCQIDVTDVTADTFEQIWPHGKSQVYRATGNQLEVTLSPRDALVLIGKGKAVGG